MYTIGQISKMFDLPVSTLRYYDKEGLFPNMERTSGIRKFSESEIEALHVIECLKKTGMEIKDIKQFMAWCAEGPSTYSNRKNSLRIERKPLKNNFKSLKKIWQWLTSNVGIMNKLFLTVTKNTLIKFFLLFLNKGNTFPVFSQRKLLFF